MAATLSAQAAAAIDPTFRAVVQDAIAQEGVLIYNAATILNANLQAGVAVTSIPVVPSLSSGIAAGTVILLGGEVAVATITGSGASAIACAAFTPTRHHSQGEIVSPPSISNQASRAAFANRLLQSPLTFEEWTRVFCWVLASQGLDKASTDAAIAAGVLSAWNLLAGA